MDVTGIILAGGLSLRMGEDKALLSAIEGQSLMSYSIQRLQQVCSGIIISSGTKESFEEYPWPKVYDYTAEQGPLAGIVSALEITPTDVNIILAVDMPAVSAPFLSFLVSCLNGYRGVIPMSEKGILQPLCGVYTKALGSELHKEMERGRRHATVVSELSEVYILKTKKEHPGYRDDIFTNLNTPEELANYRRRQ